MQDFHRPAGDAAAVAKIAAIAEVARSIVKSGDRATYKPFQIAALRHAANHNLVLAGSYGRSIVTSPPKSAAPPEPPAEVLQFYSEANATLAAKKMCLELFRNVESRFVDKTLTEMRVLRRGDEANIIVDGRLIAKVVRAPVVFGAERNKVLGPEPSRYGTAIPGVVHPAFLAAELLRWLTDAKNASMWPQYAKELTELVETQADPAPGGGPPIRFDRSFAPAGEAEAPRSSAGEAEVRPRDELYDAEPGGPREAEGVEMVSAAPLGETPIFLIAGTATNENVASAAAILFPTKRCEIRHRGSLLPDDWRASFISIHDAASGAKLSDVVPVLSYQPTPIGGAARVFGAAIPSAAPLVVLRFSIAALIQAAKRGAPAKHIAAEWRRIAGEIAKTLRLGGDAAPPNLSRWVGKWQDEDVAKKNLMLATSPNPMKPSMVPPFLPAAPQKLGGAENEESPFPETDFFDVD